VARILIVDDHEIARKGIHQALAEGLPGAEFGEAANAHEALSSLAGGRWDALLLDLNLPGRGGLDLLSEVKRSWPRVRVLVVSAYGEEEFALRCLRLGADGYVTKTSGSKALVTAVGKVLGGGKYVTPALAEKLAAAAGGGLEHASHEDLSVRELQVFRLIAKGMSLREIAAELHLGERTIGTYRARIGSKLGLSTNVEITRYALLHKLVD
jgi:two-component system, NarL family, invasion response regulator UvrY